MIEIDKLNDGYYNFPYQSGEGDSTSDTSSPCVGGFDLIQHPELKIFTYAKKIAH